MPEFVTTLEVWFDAENEEIAAEVQNSLKVLCGSDAAVTAIELGEIELLD